MISISEVRKKLGIESKKELLDLIEQVTGKRYSEKTTKISDAVWEKLQEYYLEKPETHNKVLKKEEILKEEENFLASLGIIKEDIKEKQASEEKEKEKEISITKKEEIKKTDTKFEKGKNFFKSQFEKERRSSKGFTTKEKQTKFIKKPVKKTSITEGKENKEIKGKKYNKIFEKKSEKQISKPAKASKSIKQVEGSTISSKKTISEKEKKQIKIEKQAKISDTLKKKEEVVLPDSITVKEFSEKIGVPVSEVMKKLIQNKILVGITGTIDFDTAALIAEEFGVKVKKEEKGLDIQDLIEGNLQKILEMDKEAEVLEERPPIVTIMGHVDHGKTKLLDYIRKTNVVEREAGGITQSIGASQIEFNGKKITFIDTPGHELFTQLRARGAKITDIAVIVVAADEGVKPQTIEAIDHARDAGVPIIVAITKIDKPNANIEKVKSQLSEYGLIPTDWGGDTEVVPVSAVTGEGVDELLELILLQAEVLELRYNPNRPGIGVILESHKDLKKGVVASVILMTGTLKVGDPILVFDTWGKVRKLISWKGESLDKIKGGDPAQILGIEDVPQPGRILEVVGSEKEAKEKALKVREKLKEYEKKSVLSNLLEKIKKGDKLQLKLILKSDSWGSLEALKAAINKIEFPENVEPKIIHADVGSISDSDVILAEASEAVIIGFNVPLSSTIKKKADKLKVNVKIFNIIYDFIDYISNLSKGLIKPEEKEVYLGKLEVLGIFYKKGNEMIVGGKVIDGKVKNGAYFKLYRKNVENGQFEEIGGGKVISLKREIENVDEVRQGYECGIKVKTSKRIQLGDLIGFYIIE